jgi:hypothetical protein
MCAYATSRRRVLLIGPLRVRQTWTETKSSPRRLEGYQLIHRTSTLSLSFILSSLPFDTLSSSLYLTTLFSSLPSPLILRMDRHGRPEEELFLAKPTANTDSPTVGPLRINKLGGGSASNTPPPQSTPSPSGSSASQFKSPTGPLPYPDDRPKPQAGSSRPPYPDGSSASAGRRRGSSITAPQPSSASSRTRFDANDPNRPTVSGYANAPITKDPRIASPAQSTKSSGSAGAAAAHDDDTDGLFQKDPQRPGAGGRKPSADMASPFPDYHQQYWPPPATSGAKTGGLAIPNPGGNGIHRLDSTASVSTTRATRGSPPPPETPILPPPGGGIEARYAAAGFGGPSSTSLSAAASQRQAQYGSAQSRIGVSPPAQQQTPPRRPWTPTEQPGSQPHGPPTVYQGPTEVPTPSATSFPPLGGAAAALNSPPPGNSVTAVPPVRPSEQALEQDFSRLNVNMDEPPPAYSTVHPSGAAQGFPNDKGRPANIVAPSPAGPTAQMPHNQGHPAFHNDPRLQPGATPSPAHGSPGPSQKQGNPNASPAPTVGPASPPPLPEGWIAHLDPNSGQYYYIHLATQSTQWEFPKGPTPLNLSEPLSPTGTFVNPLTSPVGSTFKQPLQSPGFPVPQSATFRPETYMSMASMASPTAAGFTGPPPTAGMDVYKVAPTNSVYFGPYLRYMNMDVERGLWMGSILLVTDAAQPPTIHIHQSVDLSPNRK